MAHKAILAFSSYTSSSILIGKGFCPVPISTVNPKTGSTQPTLSAACFVVQSCLADADFVVFSNYCLIGTRHMFVRFLWMLQTVKYPQRSKLPTFHTLSKVLKLHMSFNTVPILWLEGRAGMVRAS